MHEKRTKGSHLKKYERDEIEILRRKGYTLKEVARAIGVAPSAIWYELAKRTRKRRCYNASYANHQAYVKRKYARAQGMKIAENTALQKVVETYLLDDQSPEHVAQRIKLFHRHLPRISGILIRRYIASPYGRRIEAHRNKIFKRRSRFNRRSSILEGKRMISKRPAYINKRKHIGDTEGDFVVSGRSGKGMIFNITDRKSRAPFLEKVYPVSIRAMENALRRIKKRFPELKTITFDNDILFVHHQELERKFNIKVYFCHPGRPYEKGTNENRNRIVRRYIPKGSDISGYTRRYMQRLEEKLQRQIMKCLNYRTPAEILKAYREKKKKR